ncbi:MAG: glycosyltransferase family 2 protein [Patescibacteria group bacterium]|nr:glycosyltransferase family 2 protein [Patescibacteria group bacterium]
MKISVIIPAYNEEKYIEDCLKSIIKYAPTNLLEIIVVDNASTDNTALIAKKFPGVKVVREDRKGLTIARQKGLLEAKGDLLAYLDADTRIPPCWFDIVNKEFLIHKNVVCLSGPYTFYDLSKMKQIGVKLYYNILMIPGYKITRFLAIGGNFIAKRDALIKIGGFDTSIPFYSEDANFAKRLKKVGKLKFLKKLYVYSSSRRLTEEGLVKMGAVYFINYVSQLLFEKPITKKYKDIR